MRVLNAHDVSTLKSSLDEVAIKIDHDPDVFQSFYQFAFKFCLTVGILRKSCASQCLRLTGSVHTAWSTPCVALCGDLF